MRLKWYKSAGGACDFRNTVLRLDNYMWNDDQYVAAYNVSSLRGHMTEDRPLSRLLFDHKSQHVDMSVRSS